MLEKIDQIHKLLNIPNVDADTEIAITNMKILNLLVNLRAEAEQLIIGDVSKQRELFNVVLDFTEDLAMCSEDYNRSELWDSFKQR